MSRLIRFLLIALTVAGCSRDFASDKLGIGWTPPSGIRLSSEDDGPPVRAAFSDGVIWYRLDGVQVSLNEDQLPATLETAATAAHAPLDGTLLSSKVGTLPLGPVARYEVRGTGYRALVYLVPHGDSALLLLARAPDARYGMISASVERSLSTLHWR